MTDELAAGKEKIRKELEEVKARIRDHQQLVTDLEFSLLKLRAKPKPFGKLALPEPEQMKLTAAEKFRLRNAAEISKQELGKFIGIRVSDYKPNPESFVVELTVTNKKGTHVGPFYVAFTKNDDDSYRVIKSQMPHEIIMSETNRNFLLENKYHLGIFVRELRVCCQSFVDRKDQVEDLLAVRDKRMMPTISYDDGYLFLELGVMLDKIGGKLRIFYHHNKIFPHNFTLALKDTTAHKTWSEALRLLYKCSLVEALGLLSVKKDSLSGATEIDSPAESIQTQTTRKSQSSTQSHPSPRKSRAGGEKSSATLGKSKSSDKAKTENKFSFTDSSDDEGNRSSRMRKKRAKIDSNIRRKTYWSMLQQRPSVASESAENSEASAADSEVAKELSTRKTKDNTTNTKTTTRNKNVQPTKSRKRPNEKQPKGVVSKARRMATPPAVSDSELSDDESASDGVKSKKTPVLAPIFRKSSAAKSAARKTSSTKAVASPRTTTKEKQPLLAAIFQKARRSLTEAEKDLSISTKKQGAIPDKANNLSKTRQQSASESGKEQAVSPAKSSTGEVSSKPRRKATAIVREVHDQSKTGRKPSASSREPDELPAKSAAQSKHVKSAKLSPEKAVNEKVSPPPKNSQASQVSKTSSDTSTIVHEEQNSDTILSGTKSVTPRKVTILNSNSQESARNGRESASDSSPPFSSLSTVAREEVPRTGTKTPEQMKAPVVLLPRIGEESLLQLSPHKQNASEVKGSHNEDDAESGAVSKKGEKRASSKVILGKKGKVQDEDLPRKSPRRRDEKPDSESESGVKSKKGRKEAASKDIFEKQGKVQDEDLPRKSPRRRDEKPDSESESGVKSKKGRKEAASKDLFEKQGKVQDEDLPRKSPRRKDEKPDSESESGVKSKKGRKEAASKDLFGKKGKVQDEDLPRKSPRKNDAKQDSESEVGSKKGGKEAASKVLFGKKGKVQDEDLPRKSPRRRDMKPDSESESGVRSKKGRKEAASKDLFEKQGKVQDEDLPRKSPRRRDEKKGNAESKISRKRK